MSSSFATEGKTATCREFFVCQSSEARVGVFSKGTKNRSIASYSFGRAPKVTTRDLNFFSSLFGVVGTVFRASS